MVSVPGHIVLPESLTGVKAKIIVALGETFPMITAHKVLAAYGCLAPRLINGEFDPTKHKALWPSTGNYCRGGVSVSRIMGCRGVAILPEQMSKERFDWLDRWVADPVDVVKTVGSESNVKEIYDKCQELDRDPNNIIFNQFCEFGNVHAHYEVTGQALGHVFAHTNQESNNKLNLFAYVSATGSAGTLSAGDRLKDDFGCKLCAVESQECPTLLYNGFGDHNIQGIGDKHIPYIHNVMNTDFVAGISDSQTDCLSYLFNNAAGQKYLKERRGVPADVVDRLPSMGYSGIANTLAAIKIAKYHNLGADQVIVTVATDGAALYSSDEPMILQKYFGGRFDEVAAAEVFARYMLGNATDHFMELSHKDRERIFNLGYFTWVEQQGVELDDFKARHSQAFWKALRPEVRKWDQMIEKFNADVAGAGRMGSAQMPSAAISASGNQTATRARL
jgi:cysteine synthase